ncbi:MAG TPA: ATP synthase F1 subunit delta [Candidatus Moranbacteria bacterium]|nr:ATP synthase F1 subunit delta [Candidatus Moranbacteria bacterium]
MKVSIKQYSQTLFEMTDGKSEQELLVIVKKFAEQLKADGQLKNAGKIMEKFGELYNAANGIVVAEVTTRYKIQDTRYKQIEEFIKEKYSAKVVEIENVINEKIQGGIIIKINDDIIDGSVKKQLTNLKNKLIS